MDTEKWRNEHVQRNTGQDKVELQKNKKQNHFL